METGIIRNPRENGVIQVALGGTTKTVNVSNPSPSALLIFGYGCLTKIQWASNLSYFSKLDIVGTSTIEIDADAKTITFGTDANRMFNVCMNQYTWLS